MENKRQNIELADIFNKYGEGFLENHNLCPVQTKAFNSIVRCRTAALSYNASECNSCGHVKYSYNSCRNRHCPKCQFVKQAQWVDKLKANLPPTKYFHLVFTIPQCLHKTFYINQADSYTLLFKAAAEALKNCSANPKFLGAQTGAVAILHTWGQTLTYHPHIHMIVPAGGLSEDDMEWVPSATKFLLPVKVLSALFRGILCKYLQKAVTKKQISLAEGIHSFDELKKQLYLKSWNVYCKNSFAGPQRVIEYLGKYTHRVAISNHRIISDDNGRITFRYKDSQTGIFNKLMTLDATEFIMRFLMHILPCGFYKIRYFGILAQSNAQSKAALCFDLLEKQTFLGVLEGLPAIDVWRMISGNDPLCCPVCKKGKMIPVSVLHKKKKQPG